jgi:hypothetical protein
MPSNSDRHASFTGVAQKCGPLENIFMTVSVSPGESVSALAQLLLSAFVTSKKLTERMFIVR